jgi:hypothetical protein
MEGETTKSHRYKFVQFFKKIRIMLKVKKKPKSNKSHLIPIEPGLNSEDIGEINESEFDLNLHTISSEPIDIGRKFNDCDLTPRCESDRNNFKSNNNHDDSSTYIIDDWDQLVFESDPNFRRFTIGDQDDNTFKVKSASPIAELITMSPSTIKKFIPNDEPHSIRVEQGHVRYESIDFKSSKRQSKSRKIRRSTKKKSSLELKEKLEIDQTKNSNNGLRQHRNRRLDYCIALLYPGLNTEAILNVKFYLQEEYTLLTPLYYTLDQLYVSRQYLDYKLLKETMHYLFDYEQFECDWFLKNESFLDYGACHCIMIGYQSKMIVISFQSGFNITLDIKDVAKIKNGIY